MLVVILIAVISNIAISCNLDNEFRIKLYFSVLNKPEFILNLIEYKPDLYGVI